MRPQLNNILIIDDNRNDLELAQHYLNKSFDDLMFLIATSRKDFDEKFSWLKPDLIICDFDLPDCTGLDILIRVREEHLDIPFIFMSGTLTDNDDTLSKSILNGANGYVLKDKINKLPAVIEHVMDHEYKKRSIQQEKDMAFNKIKLKLSKSIEMLKSGIETERVLDQLTQVKSSLDDF